MSDFSKALWSKSYIRWILLKQFDLINGLKIKDLKFNEKYNVPIVGIIDNNGKSLINPQTEKVL